MVVDAQATPAMAQQVIERVRKVTDKPIKYVLLTHYHAVRVLGASAYKGAEILCSDIARDMIVERGRQDMDSEIGRFPRLFRAVESIPGLTWPSITFAQRMSVWLGNREVRVMPRRGATRPGPEILFLCDLRALSAVQCGARLRRGEGHRSPGDLDRRARPRDVGGAAGVRFAAAVICRQC